MATEVSEAKVNLGAKEIELMKLLASNDPKNISDGIKQIKQLLLKNSEDSSDAFQLNDYLTIWRGLFYFMCTSDKPVPQESVTEKLSDLIHSCTSYQGKIFFLDAFFLTIKDNWMSIRQHRIDKCMMWVRHCLRQLIFTFVNCDWNLEYMNAFGEVLYRALKSFTLSLKTHLQVIFLEELANVSRGKVPSEALVIILDSFLHYISELNNFMLIREVTRNVFRNLLSPSPDLELLEAKFQDFQKMIDPGNSNNDLEELVEGDICNDNYNEINDNSLNPQAGNISVEIPRIKFNPKDIAKVLNKYLTEVVCTKKCLLEITKLIQFYNCLGDCILPNKAKDFKLNSQVLQHNKKKNLSKMAKGVEKLEMVDSRIKKSGLKVYDHKSIKELNKMGGIVVERGQIIRSMWKVSNVDNVNTLKDNFNLKGSWSVSKETIIDGTNTVCINDDKPPIVVPPGFNVEFSEFPEKTLSKVQNKVFLTPNFKSLTVDSSLKESNSKKRKSRIENSKMNYGSKNKFTRKQNPRFIQISKPNALNVSNKNSLSISADHGGSASKKINNSIECAKAVQSVNASSSNKKMCTIDNGIEETNQIKDDPPLMAPAGYSVEFLEEAKQILKKLRKNNSLHPNFKFQIVDSSLNEINSIKPKSKSQITKKNDASKNKNIKKQNSLFIKIGTPNALNANPKNSLSIPADHGGSVSKKIKNIESEKAAQLENALPFIITNITPDNEIGLKNQIDDEPPLLAPAGFNVEVSETLEKKLKKMQKKVTINPNFKFVTVDSILKELNKMGGIVVKRGKIRKPMWKVGNVDNVNTSKEKLNLNRSWTVSKETIIDGTNTVCINDDKPPIVVPPGFNVEFSEFPEKTPTKVQNKVSLTPNFKSSTVDSSFKEINSNKRKSSEISKMNDGSKTKQNQNSRFIHIGMPNALNASHKNSFSISGDHGGYASKKIKNIIESAKAVQSVNASPFNKNIFPLDNKIEETNQIKDDPPLVAPAGYSVEFLEEAKQILKKLRKNNSLHPNFKFQIVDSSLNEINSNKSKSKSQITKKNDASKNKNIKKQNSLFIKIGTPNALNANPKNSLSISADHGGSVSKKIKNIESEKAAQLENALPFIITNLTPDNEIGLKNQIDDEPPLLAPAGFNVEVSETLEKKLRKMQKKVTINPNFKFVTVDSILKELNKMGGIVVKRGKIRKPMWKVGNVDNVNTSKENLNLNRSWTVSKETIIDGTNTVCINDDKPPILVPPGFNVEVLESPEKTPTKVQNKVSLTPNFKSSTVDSSFKEINSNKRKSSEISKMNDGSKKKQNQNSRFIQIGMPNALNASHKNSFSISGDHGGYASKKIKNIIESAKAVQSVNASPFNKNIFPLDNKIEETNQIDDLLISKVKPCSDEININSNLNDSWSVCSDEKLKSSKCKSLVSNTANEPNEKSIQKSNSPFDKICSQNIVNTSHNNSWSLSADNDGYASNKVKKSNPSSKVEKDISLISIITPDKSSSPKTPTSEQRVLRQRTNIIPKNKSDGRNEGTPKRKVKETSSTKVLEERRKTATGSKRGEVEKGILFTSVITPDRSSSPKTPTSEQRVLRRRTIIIPKNKSNGQNEGTPKIRVKETSATKVLQEHRKTIAGEEISMLTPEEISNKALEKVRSEAFEDGFGSLRKSPRLSIKTDSAKK